MFAGTMWLESYLITINGSLLSLVLFNLGRLNVIHLIMIRKINFDRHLFTSKSCTLHNVFMSFLSRGHDDNASVSFNRAMH